MCRPWLTRPRRFWKGQGPAAVGGVHSRLVPRTFGGGLGGVEGRSQQGQRGGDEVVPFNLQAFNLVVEQLASQGLDAEVVAGLRGFRDMVHFSIFYSPFRRRHNRFVPAQSIL